MEIQEKFMASLFKGGKQKQNKPATSKTIEVGISKKEEFLK